jgi:hypothetical protein
VLGYLFLGQGARGLFDGRSWPTPSGGLGGWVSGRLDGPDAVRAYEIDDLPYWIDDELWVVEADGEVRREARLARASRGRLVSRSAGWNAEAAQDCALACALRARDVAVDVIGRDGHEAAADLLAGAEPPRLEEVARGLDGELSGLAAEMAAYVADALFYARDAPTPGGAAAVSAYITARAVGRARPPDEYHLAFAAERAWQAGWIRRRADLSPLGTS